MLADFLVPALAIGLAELGDKTQLAVLLLAAGTKRHASLFAGVIAGFLVVDGLAVAFGAVSANVVPAQVIRVVSGSLFILFGVLTLKGAGGDGGGEVKGVDGPFRSGFLVIAAYEMGDKTQVVAALFAAEYEPLLVLAGTLTALAALSAGAIYLGRHLAGRMDKRLLSKAAGALFVLIGLATLIAQ